MAYYYYYYNNNSPYPSYSSSGDYSLNYSNPSIYPHPNYYEFPSSNYYYSNIAYSFNEPKQSEQFYLYYPDESTTQSQLVISYSNHEFNEPEFEEYDDTPYDGGYDIIKTYGKPLPPSDQTCYPRYKQDEPASVDAKGEEKDESSKLMELPSQPSRLDEAEQQEKIVEEGAKEKIGNENGEMIKLVPSSDHYPSGYGLETIDLCESLFGYWPCLSKMKRRIGEGYGCNCEDVRGQEFRDEMMYRGTVDYIFGNLNPYGGIESEYYNNDRCW